LTIPITALPATLGIREEHWSDASEGVEAWIRWYDSLEPLEFSPEERVAWEAACREEKQYELAQWGQRSRAIEAHFP
jgi:hypothetical protein